MKLIAALLFFVGTVVPAYSASRYSVGDSVTYLYSGEYRPSQIELTEKVISKSGVQLTILAEIKGSDIRRTWKQIVTDTRENQKSNKVDKLIEINEGKEIELSNIGNKDLFRLYDGTYLTPEGALRNKKIIRKNVSVCGKKIRLKCETGAQKVKGEDWDVETCTSSDFLWTHVSGRYSTGKRVLYSFEVIGCGQNHCSADRRGAPITSTKATERSAEIHRRVR